MGHLCVRCGGEEQVHRPTLVGFEVAEHDPAQPFEGQHRCDGVGHQREHAARSGVENGRLVGVDQELVERETRWPDVGDECGESVDVIGDFVDVCFHGRVSFRVGAGC